VNVEGHFKANIEAARAEAQIANRGPKGQIARKGSPFLWLHVHRLNYSDLPFTSTN